MGAYGDNLTFNVEQLQSQIGILEQVRDTIQASKKNYVDYVNTQLKPAWTTDAGQQTVNQLINFAEIDIEGFITYLTGRITDLEEAKVRVMQINEA